MTIAIAVATLALIAVNSAATLTLVHADWYTQRQKLAQSLVVWLIPGIGAALVVLALLTNRDRPELRSHHVPNNNDIGLNAGESSHGVSHDL